MKRVCESYYWRGKDLVLNVRLHPRAKREEIAGFHGNQLRVRVTAPAVGGKANAQLIAYLSQIFKVKKSRIEIIGGKLSRDKQLQIRAPQQLPDTISKP